MKAIDKRGRYVCKMIRIDFKGKHGGRTFDKEDAQEGAKPADILGQPGEAWDGQGLRELQKVNKTLSNY